MENSICRSPPTKTIATFFKANRKTCSDWLLRLRPSLIQVSILSTFYICLLYKSVFRRFSLVTVWLWIFFGKRIAVQKLLIKCWWNWLELAFHIGDFPTVLKHADRALTFLVDKLQAGNLTDQVRTQIIEKRYNVRHESIVGMSKVDQVSKNIH